MASLSLFTSTLLDLHEKAVTPPRAINALTAPASSFPLFHLSSKPWDAPPLHSFFFLPLVPTALSTFPPPLAS